MSEVSVLVTPDGTVDLEELRTKLEERGFRSQPSERTPAPAEGTSPPAAGTPAEETDKKRGILRRVELLVGAIDKDLVPELEKVPGVNSVVQSRTRGVGPPDSKVQ
jgi:hypothetical protein